MNTPTSKTRQEKIQQRLATITLMRPRQIINGLTFILYRHSESVQC